MTGRIPVQVVVAYAIAVAVLVTRHLLPVAAGLLLMTGTIVGFVLVRSVGLFGFKLGFSSGLANTRARHRDRRGSPPRRDEYGAAPLTAGAVALSRRPCGRLSTQLLHD